MTSNGLGRKGAWISIFPDLVTSTAFWGFRFPLLLPAASRAEEISTESLGSKATTLQPSHLLAMKWDGLKG